MAYFSIFKWKHVSQLSIYLKWVYNVCIALSSRIRFANKIQLNVHDCMISGILEVTATEWWSRRVLDTRVSVLSFHATKQVGKKNRRNYNIHAALLAISISLRQTRFKYNTRGWRPSSSTTHVYSTWLTSLDSRFDWRVNLNFSWLASYILSSIYW